LCNKRIITGELPINKDSFIVKGSILNPEQVLADYVKYELGKDSLLIIKGKTIIQHKSEINDALNLLMVYKSPTVSEIVEQTNLHSINLFAEMLLRHIDIKLNGNGTNISATQNLENYWQQQGLNKNNMNFYDGSGLSSYNLISAKQLVKVLQMVYNDSILFENFKPALPIAGKTGTLKRMFKKTSLTGKVYAKSGSMSGVRAYSGYIFTQNYHNPIIFSIIFNNYTAKSTSIKAKIQQLIVSLSKN
jgi:D-alanyl-D-alanine carboxypeptidase/D-alanyl-D-alanine-endopeptidase (penicillin-binding protein 4)